MRGDPVRAGLGGEQRRTHRIGITRAARVPDRRDMVDIDPEAKPTIIGATQVTGHAARLPGLIAGIAASSAGSASAA